MSRRRRRILQWGATVAVGAGGFFGALWSLLAIKDYCTAVDAALALTAFTLSAVVVLAPRD